jgi:hypothetical protein
MVGVYVVGYCLYHLLPDLGLCNIPPNTIKAFSSMRVRVECCSLSGGELEYLFCPAYITGIARDYFFRFDLHDFPLQFVSKIADLVVCECRQNNKIAEIIIRQLVLNKF